eukprot:CAMPEP_0176103560 /NCGR_PEP_ID=MMETSP0120_2-20121206/51959_1 /TAXON_ID=160619 /ORGANISM="Kryptoperidinium foliaceum, Strain CCMP 1326" /LENGTH=93 /DNA_ID=CAMNT_0017437651 /DNA_START=90 /DNA_END=369 /DNA_ORIENTATION=+
MHGNNARGEDPEPPAAHATTQIGAPAARLAPAARIGLHARGGQRLRRGPPLMSRAPLADNGGERRSIRIGTAARDRALYRLTLLSSGRATYNV